MTNRVESLGQPLIRVAPMPSDCNPNGDIFGGWVLSQMDIAGGTLASSIAKGRVATVAVDAMRFNIPIKVGDVVSIYSRGVTIGRTSIRVDLVTFVQRRSHADVLQVTEGIYTFVAIDLNGKPRPVQPAD